jgi:hypothetical protein
MLMTGSFKRERNLIRPLRRTVARRAASGLAFGEPIALVRYGA